MRKGAHSCTYLLIVLVSLVVSPGSLRADTWNDYSLNDQYRGGIAVSESNQSSTYSQWTTKPIGQNLSHVIWGSPASNPGNSVEEFEVRPNCSAGGQSWVYLNSLGSRDTRYALHTTQALFITSTGTYDLTNNGCGTNGHPYALFDVYSGTYTMKVWGWIAKPDGSKSRDFYWQQTVTTNQNIHNPCWTSDSINTRKSIVLDEVWWDQWGGWIIGSGALDNNGVPTGSSVAYGRQRIFAKGAGRLWRYSNFDNGDNACLKSGWSW